MLRVVDDPGVFAVVVCRFLLAAVFALAAGTKLADRPATRVAVLGFGVPESLATVALWALIAGELVTTGPLRPRAFGGLGADGMKKEIPERVGNKKRFSLTD
jgi:hypothetical protein